jgi:hypothetical protein
MSTEKKSPYHHLFRLLHWVLSISMLTLIGTGIGLHAIARPGWSLFGAFKPWMPAGNLMFIHYVAALFFAPAALISIVLFLKRFKPKKSHFKQLRWITNYLLVIGSIVSIISSLGLLLNVSIGTYQFLRFLHLASGLFITPLALTVHIVMALSKHIKILPMVFFPFRQPKWASLLWYPAIALFTSIVLLQVIPKKTGQRLLTAEKTENAPAEVENLKDLSWNDTKTLEIQLINGVGFDRGSSRMKLNAMYDDTYLYIRANWTDPELNTLYWPVKRTADGWKYMQSSWNDEQIHYEDKFSMIFPVEESQLFNQFGCSISCHQSKDAERFPYGYKATPMHVDVWHWKGSRSGSVGYVDDKYWHEADMDRKDVGRYGDGGIGGPYTKNINKEHTAPLYLPKDDSFVINNGGALLREGAVEYTEELAANIPEGTIIPGVVVSPFPGDRGHVECSHDYSDGAHTLWIRRKLDTNSDDDVKFVPGQSVAFSTAAFDHAAKRHAYHMAVYRLYLKP